MHLCYSVNSSKYPYLLVPELLNFQLITSESILTVTLRKPLPHPLMNQSNPDLILMNFKLPISLKQEFQYQCKTHKMFMTNVLINLIQNYLNQKTNQTTHENK